MSADRSQEPDLALRSASPVVFEKDAEAEAQLDKTLRLDSVKQEDYDAVFYPGGQGPRWDLAEDKNSIELIENFFAAGKTIALVCYSSGALRTMSRPRKASRSSRTRT